MPIPMRTNDEDTQTDSDGDPTEIVDRVVDLYPRPDRNDPLHRPESHRQTPIRLSTRFVASSTRPTSNRIGRQACRSSAARSSQVDEHDVATLVSGDRLQPLHQLHGVRRLLFVWCLRRRWRSKIFWSSSPTIAAKAARLAVVFVPRTRSSFRSTKHRPSPEHRSRVTKDSRSICRSCSVPRPVATIRSPPPLENATSNCC